MSHSRVPTCCYAVSVKEMNTTIITILISEIIVLVLILGFLIKLNRAVNCYREKVITQNEKLKKTLPTLRDIFTLTHQYIEMWKEEFAKKIEASGNVLGEFVAYYLILKLFKKQYDQLETGFKFAQLLW